MIKMNTYVKYVISSLRTTTYIFLFDVLVLFHVLQIVHPYMMIFSLEDKFLTRIFDGTGFSFYYISENTIIVHFCKH
jgi:hypothetical protein